MGLGIGIGLGMTLNPSEGGGVNIVVNGGFDTDTIWSKGTGWAIAAGKATSTPGTGSNLSQDVGFIVGRTYRITFTISGRTAGVLACYPGIGAAPNPYSVNGTFQLTVVAVGNSTLYSQKDASFDGSIDDVSAYLV